MTLKGLFALRIIQLIMMWLSFYCFNYFYKYQMLWSFIPWALTVYYIFAFIDDMIQLGRKLNDKNKIDSKQIVSDIKYSINLANEVDRNLKYMASIGSIHYHTKHAKIIDESLIKTIQEECELAIPQLKEIK